MNSAIRKPRLRFFVGLLLACALAGCGKASAPAAEEEHPAPVKAVAARTVAVGEWTEVLGTTQPLPDRIARITAAVEGRVVSVLGDGKGARVRPDRRGDRGRHLEGSGRHQHRDAHRVPGVLAARPGGHGRDPVRADARSIHGPRHGAQAYKAGPSTGSHQGAKLAVSPLFFWLAI